jgi:hypothetical protein
MVVVVPPHEIFLRFYFAHPHLGLRSFHAKQSSCDYQKKKKKKKAKLSAKDNMYTK